MPMRKRKPPLHDPEHVPDAFASDFAVEDFEDWLRVIGWSEHMEGAGDGGGGKAELRKSVAFVMPRSSLRNLIDVLTHSSGGFREEKPS